jgi:hypothetical protein
MRDEVVCDIEIFTDVNAQGRKIESTRAICSECGHETTSYGTGDGSRKRCLVLMNEECPEGQNNFYVSEEDSE